MISRLRIWWQLWSGEYDTPFDEDLPAWGWSIAVHLLLLLAVGMLTLPAPQVTRALTLVSPVVDETDRIEPSEFVFSDLDVLETGADSVAGEEAALSQAPVVAELADVSFPDTPAFRPLPVQLRDPLVPLAGLSYNQNLATKGTVGVGTVGAAGAVDQLTAEILTSLEERPTLVVWLFDKSASLIRQRAQIQDRIGKIYDELGQIASTRKTRASGEPLVASMIAFGQDVELLTERPTADVSQLKEQLQDIKRDDSGRENVFQAVYLATEQFRRLRTTKTRNVLLIVFTDEAGDDDEAYLERCVTNCRRYEMPVYVVGVPAPFGRRQAEIKWVDPDPAYDQTPQRGLVDQGPESLIAERIQLRFPGREGADPVIDSGFGPFALTRLCYESGGIYFAVHANRRLGSDVGDWQTENYASYLRRFFDPDVMRGYRPDYVSRTEYLRQIELSATRTALVKAAAVDWGNGIRLPRRRFVKRDEASFARQLTAAQKAAAILEPRLNQLHEVLRGGEADRSRETKPRWQAGYDLAMGRALAAKVRAESFNALLAQAKRGLAFEQPTNNTWVVEPTDKIELGSQIEKNAERARGYLRRVLSEHPETPWSYLAGLELKQPIGWRWVESHTELAPPASNEGNNVGNANRTPRDDQRQMLPPPKPRRPLPNL